MGTTTIEPIITEPYVETRTDHLLPKPKKPSEILREMPRERWMDEALTDGRGRFCSVGWLAAKAGDLSFLSVNAYDVVKDFYDLMFKEVEDIWRLNDTDGLDAVIRYLECIGR